MPMLPLPQTLPPAAVMALGEAVQERSTFRGLATALGENTAATLLDQLDAEVRTARAEQQRGLVATHRACLRRIAFLALVGIERLIEGRPL